MGAGLTIRKSAWQHLIDSGFRFLLVGRQGAALTAGEDHELCHALCLAGWRLWYEPHLRLRHFLPLSRLKWRLLRRQSRGAGRCEAVLGLYLSNISNISNQQGRSELRKILKSIKETWSWQILVSIRYLARRPFRLLWSFVYSFEGDYHIIWVERQLGKFLELIARRREYGLHVHEIREAAWRRVS